MVTVRYSLNTKNVALPIYKFLIRKQYALFIILGLIVFSISIAMFIGNLWDIALMFILFYAATLALYCFGYAYTKKKLLNPKIPQKSNSYCYARFENQKYYTYTVNGNESTLSGEFSYSCIQRVIESNNFFLMCISENCIIPLPKANICRGNADTLRELFKRNLGKKFKTKRINI